MLLWILAVQKMISSQNDKNVTFDLNGSDVKREISQKVKTNSGSKFAYQKHRRNQFNQGLV